MSARYEVRFRGWWIDAREREDTYSWTDDLATVAWIRKFLRESCPHDRDRSAWTYVRTVDHATGQEIN